MLSFLMNCVTGVNLLCRVVGVINTKIWIFAGWEGSALLKWILLQLLCLSLLCLWLFQIGKQVITYTYCPILLLSFIIEVIAYQQSYFSSHNCTELTGTYFHTLPYICVIFSLNLLCSIFVSFIPFFSSVKKIITPAGKKLAGSIISEKLAACVNIVPGRN